MALESLSLSYPLEFRRVKEGSVLVAPDPNQTVRLRNMPNSAAAVVHALLTQRRRLRLLQIGANDASDSTSNDPVQGMLRHHAVRAGSSSEVHCEVWVLGRSGDSL